MPEQRRRPPRKTAHEVQAAIEGVVVSAGDTRKVTLKGAEFRMAEEVGAMPHLTFGYYANSGVDSNDMAGLAAIYEMLRDSIDESEWDRFRQHAVDTKASTEELMNVVATVLESNAARPTRPPGGSSAGR